MRRCAVYTLICFLAAAALSGMAAADEAGSAAETESVLDECGFTGRVAVWMGDCDRLPTRLFSRFRPQVPEGDVQLATQVRTSPLQNGVAQRTSVEHWSHPLLPYADSLVNLILYRTGPGGDLRLTRSQIQCVLAPGGMAAMREER